MADEAKEELTKNQEEPAQETEVKEPELPKENTKEDVSNFLRFIVFHINFEVGKRSSKS